MRVLLSFYSRFPQNVRTHSTRRGNSPLRPLAFHSCYRLKKNSGFPSFLTISSPKLNLIIKLFNLFSRNETIAMIKSRSFEPTSMRKKSLRVVILERNTCVDE